MLKRISALALCLCVSGSAYALDAKGFNKALDNYAEAISQTAYTTVEASKNRSMDDYDEVAERADKAANKVGYIIANIDNDSELDEAYGLVKSFSEKSDLNAYTAEQVCKMLKNRANFLISSGNTSVNTTKRFSASRAAQAATPNNLMKKRQKRLIMIETPIAEAIVCVDDTDKNRRVENLESILKRHDCKIISSYRNEVKGNDKYCYYFSGRKYVIDTLLGHFDGSVVKSDLKAYVQITTGGFWGGKKKHMFTVGPKRSDKSTMGELAWYKSVIQHDPVAYFADKDYEELSKLGSKEEVAGSKKLLLKNLKAEIWVTASDKTESEAVYHEKLELGDVYIDAK